MCNDCNNHDIDPFAGIGNEPLITRRDRTDTPQAEPTGKRHPCKNCAGSGVYKGFRLHQPESKCFACNGRGWFKTSHADRMKARAKRAQSKIDKLQAAKDAFNEANPGIIEGLQANANWSSFAADLAASFDKWGSLSDKQLAAAQRMLIKIEESRAKRQAERKAEAAPVDMVKIVEAFEVAKSNGLKKPSYRFNGVTLSLAPANGRNAGAIYVKTHGDYAGKIVDGKFQPVRFYADDTKLVETLQEIASDPRGKAIDYGRETGNCCVCDRLLTDPKSIDAGIGPVCASKWGF